MDAQQRPSILMFPWLAHGHVSPFLALAKKLSERNFQIYFCSTPVILQPIRETLPDKFLSSIQLIELHLQSSPELPPHYHTAKGLPPHLIIPLVTAFDLAKPAFSAIVRALRPDLLIYDSFQPWAPSVAREENIKGSIMFSLGSASVASIWYYDLIKKGEDPYKTGMTRILQVTINGLLTKTRLEQCYELSSPVLLSKTSKAIEANYFNLSGRLAEKRVLPTGFLVHNFAPNRSEGDDIIDWLDKKDAQSVVFISFGSEHYLSKDEIEEMAYGLELSGVCFIWVMRFDGNNENKFTTIDEALPSGFHQRIIKDEGRGVIIEGWAPQVRILGHRSIGGFISHCGWSSVTEGIVLGVPIIAMAMKSDQPYNAKLVVEIGVAKEVERDEEGKIFKRENIARVIKEVVMGQEGEVLRRRVRELSEMVSEKGDQELDEAAEELRRLCLQ